MYEENLSLIIDEGDPSYEWAKCQSDTVGALGHIGTHIDCYESEPLNSDYVVEAVTIDCNTRMPLIDDLSALHISGKALILFTGNLVNNGYGTPEYGSTNTQLHNDVLDYILSKSPLFIVIDSYGIGNHGEEHINFDKKCESKGCFVIENINLSHSIARSVQVLKISIDKTSRSTGKKCQVIALCN